MTDEKPQRVMKLPVGHQFLQSVLTTGKINIEIDGLPKDAKFRGMAHDYGKNCINIFFEHPSFEEVHPGGLFPTLIPKFTNIPEILD